MIRDLDFAFVSAAVDVAVAVGEGVDCFSLEGCYNGSILGDHYGDSTTELSAGHTEATTKTIQKRACSSKPGQKR
jgi:hypothetical protein